MIRFGSFSIATPEYKEIRAFDIWRPSDPKDGNGVDLQDIIHPQAHGRIGFVVKCRCGRCGKKNTFTIIRRAFQKMVSMV